MSINAIIKRPNHIIANTVGITTTQSNPPIDLKNNAPSINQSYLHNLLDVSEDHPQDGYTLVYNANTHKYEVRQNIVTAMDGGTF